MKTSSQLTQAKYRRSVSRSVWNSKSRVWMCWALCLAAELH